MIYESYYDGSLQDNNVYINGTSTQKKKIHLEDLTVLPFIPTYACVLGDELYFITGSRLMKYDSNGISNVASAYPNQSITGTRTTKFLFVWKNRVTTIFQLNTHYYMFQLVNDEWIPYYESSQMAGLIQLSQSIIRAVFVDEVTNVLYLSTSSGFLLIGGDNLDDERFHMRKNFTMAKQKSTDIKPKLGVNITNPLFLTIKDGTLYIIQEKNVYEVVYDGNYTRPMFMYELPLEDGEKIIGVYLLHDITYLVTNKNNNISCYRWDDECWTNITQHQVLSDCTRTFCDDDSILSISEYAYFIERINTAKYHCSVQS